MSGPCGCLLLFVVSAAATCDDSSCSSGVPPEFQLDSIDDNAFSLMQTNVFVQNSLNEPRGRLTHTKGDDEAPILFPGTFKFNLTMDGTKMRIPDEKETDRKATLVDATVDPRAIMQHDIDGWHDGSEHPFASMGIPDPFAAVNINRTIILHIGKTGGSTISKSLVKSGATQPPEVVTLGHLSSHLFMAERIGGQMSAPPYKDIVLWVRAPVRRFVSSWLSRFRKGMPEIFIPWSPEEELAFTTFPTPDELACNLSSKDPQMAAQATKAMDSIFHVKRDISYYLGGLAGANKTTSQMLLVGRQEHYEDDFERLVSTLAARNDLVSIPSLETSHQVPDALKELGMLGRCSVLNLQKRYAEDYKIIELLAARGLLNESYVSEVATLDAAPVEGQYFSY